MSQIELHAEVTGNRKTFVCYRTMLVAALDLVFWCYSLALYWPRSQLARKLPWPWKGPWSTRSRLQSGRSWPLPASSVVMKIDRLLFEPRQDPFGGFHADQPPRPGDSDFIPNGYATGIVVDARGLILTRYHVLR